MRKWKTVLVYTAEIEADSPQEAEESIFEAFEHEFDQTGTYDIFNVGAEDPVPHATDIARYLNAVLGAKGFNLIREYHEREPPGDFLVFHKEDWVILVSISKGGGQ